MMKRLIGLWVLSVVMVYGTDYQKVCFESGTQHSELEMIQNITFTNSENTIHFNLAGASVVMDNMSNVNNLVFSPEILGDQPQPAPGGIIIYENHIHQYPSAS